MTKKELIKAIRIRNGIITIEGIDLSGVSIHIKEDIGGSLHARNIGGDNTQWDIKGYNHQGEIKGHNHQGNIGGYNRQLNINGYNSQDNIEGNNSQINISGYNNQGNIGSSNYQININGNNHQNGVNGYSINSKHYIAGNVKTFDMDYTDRILLHSTKVRKLKRDVEYIEGINTSNKIVYLVKTPNLSYHSEISMSDAKRGFKEKRDKLIGNLKDWVKTLTDDTVITRKLFHEKTGSCMLGINNWCGKVGIDGSTKEITFKEFKELAEKHPTMETKRVMFVLKELRGDK